MPKSRYDGTGYRQRLGVVETLNTPARNRNILPIFYLTLGWFGVQMAMALDATLFQKLLGEHLDNAFQIGLILGLGPLAGMTVQPLMGWLGDKLGRRGISRLAIIRVSLLFCLAGTVLFAFRLSLPALVAAVAFFFVAFNVLAVSYRALVSEASNRRALLSHKGMVSGFIAGFSGLGGFAMFALASVAGNTPAVPVLASAAILLLCFVFVLKFAPGPRAITPEPADRDGATPDNLHQRAMWGGWNMVFYALPVLALIPAFERRLAQVPGQVPIFRLFLVVFFSWVGIQALRGFFVLYATHALHLTYAQANMPLAILTLVTVLAALPLGRLADRVDNRRLFRFCLLGYALACLAGCFWVRDLASAIFMSVFIGLSFAGMIVLPLSLLFKLCPPRSEGTYAGFYNLFMSVPQLYSLFITGRLIDYFHDYRVILPVGAVAALGAMLLAFRLVAPGAVVSLPETTRRAG